MATPSQQVERPRGGGIILEPKRFSRFRLIHLRTLDFWIIRSFILSYLACTLSFVGFYVLVEAFFKLHKFIPSGSASPPEIAGHFLSALFQYNLAMIPTIYVNYMGPILTLAAAMFTITIMNRGNEFTAIKASGVSVYRVVLPIFIIAACFSGLTFLLQEWVIPELREPIRKALAISRSGTIRPDKFYDPVNDIHITVKRYSPDTKVAEGVSVVKWPLTKQKDRTEKKWVIDAGRMVWIPTPDSTPRKERGQWLLHQGSIQSWTAQGEQILNTEGKDFERLKRPFGKYRLTSSLLPIDLETSDQDISYLSWKELKIQYRRQPYHRHLIVKLHHHFAFPLSHMILLLLGIPFVLNFENRNFILGLAVCFTLCAAYFLLSSMALSLASDPGSTSLPPVIAAWLPNILFGSLGLTIFTNMRS